MQEELALTTVSDEARPARLRLSIAHLLLWIAATALVVASFPKGWLGAPDVWGDRESLTDRMQQRQTLERLSVVVVAPCYGAAVASLIVAGTRLLTRRPGFPALPGHWPLVQLGLWILIVGGTLDHDDMGGRPVTYNLAVFREDGGAALVVLLMLLLAVAIQAVVVVREPRRWRVAMCCMLAAVVVPLVAFLIVPLRNPGARNLTALSIVLAWYIAALVAVLVGIWDFIRRERFDLFHWVGVVSLLGILAHPPLTWLIADMAI